MVIFQTVKPDKNGSRYCGKFVGVWHCLDEWWCSGDGGDSGGVVVVMMILAEYKVENIRHCYTVY